MMYILRSVILGGLFLSAPAAAADRIECDVSAFREEFEGLNLEGVALRQFEGPVRSSTQGASISGYFVEGSPKLVDATFFGETGKSNSRFYVHDLDTFFVETISFHYAEPLGGTSLEPMAIKRNVVFICDGAVLYSSRDEQVNPERERESLVEILSHVDGEQGLVPRQ